MKLFGHAMSLMTWQVLLALAEKDLNAEHVSIDVRGGEQRKPAHLRHHPFGHIPVIEDDGFWLYETDAILRYLDERDGKPTLSQKAPQSRAQQNQWLAVLDTYLYPAVKKVTARDYAKMMGDPDPGEDVVEQGKRDLARALTIFRNHMSGRPYVADDGYGLADIRWATFVDELGRMVPAEIETTLHALRAWRENVQARPGWERAVQARERFSNGRI